MGLLESCKIASDENEMLEFISNLIKNNQDYSKLSIYDLRNTFKCSSSKSNISDNENSIEAKPCLEVLLDEVLTFNLDIFFVPSK